MWKKKGDWKCSNSDFTLKDSADAPKPIRRLKKAQITDTGEVSWDEMADYDLVQEIDAEGYKRYIYKKKSNAKLEVDIDKRPGIIYPEIVFYLISAYIKPEQIGNFAAINKASYACTQRESFWRNLYKRYCQGHSRLPPRLRIENSFKVYGLKQRVIRALHHTYSVFVHKIELDAIQESRPHRLVKRLCVNVWYNKGPIYWLVYFKLKKVPLERPQNENGNMLDELDRIDANPDEDCQVLQVTCTSFHEVPPLLGMTLSSVSVVLSPGFRHHRLSLGFSTSAHNISRNLVPDQSVVIDTVVTILVFDWWHPKYPHFDNTLPARVKDEESMPVLKKEFFNMSLAD
ncbi:putative transmembrane protein 183BP [Cydia strobilella]|uniref:putative transmembrane protein 183BP n=1 Tax=Cydia strobilella TaxID=1100964 RepID=UPI0030073796